MTSGHLPQNEGHLCVHEWSPGTCFPAIGDLGVEGMGEIRYQMKMPDKARTRIIMEWIGLGGRIIVSASTPLYRLSRFQTGHTSHTGSSFVVRFYRHSADISDTSLAYT